MSSEVGLQTEEKKVRKKLQGGKYTMLETRKDGTKFTNKALKEVAEKLQTISRTYDSRQQKLVEEVFYFGIAIILHLIMRYRSKSLACVEDPKKIRCWW